MRKLITLFSGTLLLLLYSEVLYPQQPDQYTIYRFTSHNGLPQNSIKSMVMDDLRFIWMTTEGGLVRYDGQKFKVYSKNNHPAIGHDRFRWIVKTAEGEMLTDDLSGRSFIIRNGHFEAIKNVPPKVQTAPHLGGIIPDREIYYRIKSRELAFFGFDSIPDSPYVIIRKKEGGYFVKTNNGLLEYDRNKLIRKHILSNHSPIILFVLDNLLLYFDSNKKLYLYNLQSGISVPLNIKGDFPEIKAGQIRNNNNVIWSSAYKEVYLKIDRHLYKIQLESSTNSLYTKLIINNLPENCVITDVIEDTTSGSYFIGTESKGFYVYKKQQFKTLINTGELRHKGNIFYSQAAIDSNKVYAGYDREVSLNGIRQSNLNIGDNQVEALHTSKSGKIHYSVQDNLLYHDLTTGNKKLIATSKNNRYYSFFEEADSIFVGTKQYTGYIKNDTIVKLYYHTDQTADSKPDDIVRGPDGNLWIATCNGVFRLSDGNKKPQLVPGLNELCARRFMISGNRIFVGTYGQGYYSWEKGIITVYPVDKRRYLNHVHSFYTDPYGWIWFTTNNGIIKAKWSEVQNYKNDLQHQITYYYYGEDDGILNTEFNGGCSPPFLVLKNGYVSYPTMEGMVWFNPSTIHHNLPFGKPFIDEITVNGKLISSAGQVLVPPSSESVVIKLSLPYYGKSDNINLQYKLEGLNKDWVSISAEEMKIAFTNLPSGIHELLIRNLTADLSGANSETALVFDVEKRYFETWWFKILSGSLLLFVLAAVIKLNNSRILRKNQALENKISERTVELQEANRKLKDNLEKLEKQETALKESIQLKNRLISVISHDIITPLKFISMVSRHSKKAVTNSESHIKTMQDIEFASERLHNNASNILNWIKVQNQRLVPEIIHIALHELAEDCMEPIRGMASLKNIKLINNIPEETIIRSDKNILSIILQNLLTNSVKYTDKGTIEIWSELKNDSEIIYVSDSGVGMSEGTLTFIRSVLDGKNIALKPEENIDIGNRLGYYIISDLLKYINGTASISSDHGKGTLVTLYFNRNNG
jgi:signal transduction histidine kinase